MKFIHLTMRDRNHVVTINLAQVTCIHPSTDTNNEIRATTLRLADGNFVEVIEPMSQVLALLPED
jgi:hypothetical protein